MLWKYGAVRMPPFHQVSKPTRLMAPTLPSRSRREVMASPTTWMPRMIWGGSLGTIKEVYIDCGGPSGDCYLPEEKLPHGMTPDEWDYWMEGKPAKKLWAIKLDRKKTGPDKDGEIVAYERQRESDGKFLYKAKSGGRPWQPAPARAMLRRLAARAGVRRRFAPHQLRHAHAIELAHEGVPLNVIQRQLGHRNLGVTSIYLQGIDPDEIIQTVHARRAPMIPASVGLALPRRL